MTRCRRVALFAAFLTSAAGASGAGNLRVGAAKVDVTPWSRYPKEPAQYEHQVAHVRAIVLDNGTTRAALISVPGSEFDWPAISRQVSAELNCPAQNIVVSATHSHSFGTVRATPQPLTQPAVDAVREAKRQLQPARMGFGAGKSYLNVNRDAIYPQSRKWGQYSNLDAPSDKTVAVLKFESPSGELIAVYANYAMHPVQGYALNVTSGDFPEAMSRYVERAFGDKIIVAYSMGAGGDQNPLYLRPSTNAMATRSGNGVTGYEMDRETQEGPLRVTDNAGKQVITKPADPQALDHLYRFIESEGQLLGEEVIRVLTWTKSMTDDPRIGGLQTVADCPGRKRTNGDKLDPKTREGIEGVYVDAPPVQIPMGVLGIGSVAVATIGEEIYSLIGQKVKAEAPLSHTILATMANARGNTGYIVDDASFGKLTFQVINSALKPGCAETAIVNTIQDLETQYLNQR